jgi:hypothetical protein
MEKSNRLSEALDKACSVAAFEKNVRREYHAGKTAKGTQHFAIAINVLKRACGVDPKVRETSPKKIVAMGTATTEESEGFIPPKSVQKAAARGLELRRKHGRGGLDRKEASKQGIGSGVQRATNLKNGDRVSLDTIKRMHAFFSRHQKNKGNPGDVTPGRIAWLLWGGTPGWEWAKSILSKQEDNMKFGPGAKGRNPFRLPPVDRGSVSDGPIHRNAKSGQEQPFLDPEDFTLSASGTIRKVKPKAKPEPQKEAYQHLMRWLRES